jgi:hypothetical protein
LTSGSPQDDLELFYRISHSDHDLYFFVGLVLKSDIIMMISTTMEANRAMTKKKLRTKTKATLSAIRISASNMLSFFLKERAREVPFF